MVRHKGVGCRSIGCPLRVQSGHLSSDRVFLTFDVSRDMLGPELLLRKMSIE